MLIMKIPFLYFFHRRSGHAGSSFVVTASGNSMYCVQIKNVAGLPRLESYAHHQMDGLQASTLTSAFLEKICRNTGSFQFSTLLESNEYQLLQVDSPNVPEEEIKSSVRWSIKDSLHFNVDDAIIDVWKFLSV